MTKRDEYHALMVRAMGRISRGTRAIIAALPERSPGQYLRLNDRNGMWVAEDRRPNRFWEGFLAGRIWLLYAYTGEEAFKVEALKLTEEVAPTRFIGKDINVGFSMYHSACLGYELTGDERLKAMALEGAETVARLYHAKSGVLAMELVPAGAAPCYEAGIPPQGLDTIIDIGAPLELLWWAGRYRREFHELASRHIERIVELGLIRDDGSTYQSLEIDAESGKPGRLHTHQGYGDETHWARGQAWAMLGYAMASQVTGSRLFHETAVRCADWYVANIPPDFVPFYDFDDPASPHIPRDSCAAAIASAALIQLSNGSADLAARYRSVVESTLRELVDNYLTPAGLLLHGSWGGKHGVAVPHESVMPYGNYWIVDCLCRELVPEKRLWI